MTNFFKAEDMRIKKLGLKNFRGFEDLTIDFPEGESGLAVFVGVNGSGKTSILEGIGFMLQEFVSDVFGVVSNNPIIISTLDINKDSPNTSIQIEAEKITIDTIHWPSQSWFYTKNFKGELKSKHLTHAADGVQTIVSKNDKINLPVLAFYRTHRVVETEENGVIRLMAQQLETYHDAFDIKINFRGFINWFIDQTNIENQLKIERKDFEVTNQNLDAARKAMIRFLEELPNSDFSKLHVGVSSSSSKLSKKQTLLLSKGNKIFELGQLSEGERIILMVIFDIAYRLAVANPSVDNPLNGHGIVLIDEIDLHLHPSWQRAVVKGLRKTFPNIQFILTTHSPQVLSSLKKENVFILDDFKLVKDKPQTYGRDSNSILWDIFGVEKRPPQAKEDFYRLNRLMDDPDKVKETEALLRDMEERYGYYDEEVVRARGQFEFLNEE